jgi:hypothetical protein
VLGALGLDAAGTPPALTSRGVGRVVRGRRRADDARPSNSVATRSGLTSTLHAAEAGAPRR